MNTCEGDKLKTVFQTRNGRLKYQTMDLLRLFQGYVTKILAEKLDIFVNGLLSELHQGRRPAPWKSAVSFRDESPGA